MIDGLLSRAFVNPWWILRQRWRPLAFPLPTGVVITLIADIDRPTRGPIGVSQRPLQELLDSMQP
jgi:hypothetical protein